MAAVPFKIVCNRFPEKKEMYCEYICVCFLSLFIVEKEALKRTNRQKKTIKKRQLATHTQGKKAAPIVL